MAAEPEVTQEQLSKRWPAKFAGTCNICRKPYDEQERIGIDPGKPSWYNERGKKWVNNYAHADCIGAGTRMLNGPTHAEPEAPKPFSFDPRNQLAKAVTNAAAGTNGDLNILLRSIRDALNVYLGEDPESLQKYLETEIPF